MKWWDCHVLLSSVFAFWLTLVHLHVTLGGVMIAVIPCLNKTNPEYNFKSYTVTWTSNFPYSYLRLQFLLSSFAIITRNFKSCTRVNKWMNKCQTWFQFWLSPSPGKWLHLSEAVSSSTGTILIHKRLGCDEKLGKAPRTWAGAQRWGVSVPFFLFPFLPVDVWKRWQSLAGFIGIW